MSSTISNWSVLFGLEVPQFCKIHQEIRGRRQGVIVFLRWLWITKPGIAFGRGTGRRKETRPATVWRASPPSVHANLRVDTRVIGKCDARDARVIE